MYIKQPKIFVTQRLCPNVGSSDFSEIPDKFQRVRELANMESTNNENWLSYRSLPKKLYKFMLPVAFVWGTLSAKNVHCHFKNIAEWVFFFLRCLCFSWNVFSYNCSWIFFYMFTSNLFSYKFFVPERGPFLYLDFSVSISNWASFVYIKYTDSLTHFI